MRRAVFLDRDDTLIDNKDATAHTAHPGDLFDPALVRLLPGAAWACARLRAAGYLLIVVTNQAGIAEGICTPGQIEETNDRMRELLRGAQPAATIDGLYYSPCLRTGAVARYAMDHDWRKPGPGMIVAGLREFGVGAAASWLVGDAPRDVEAGVRAGLRPERCLRIGEGIPLPDLEAAADHILRSPA